MPQNDPNSAGVVQHQSQSVDTESNIPAELSSAHQHLLPLVTLLKHMSISSNDVDVQIACKIVLGKYDSRNRYFNTNIPVVFYKNIFEMLQRFDGWLSVTRSEDVHDYFYSTDCRQTTKSVRRKYNKKNKKSASLSSSSEIKLDLCSVRTDLPVVDDGPEKKCFPQEMDLTSQNQVRKSQSTIKTVRTRTVFKTEASQVCEAGFLSSLWVDHSYAEPVSSLFLNLDEFKNIDVNVVLEEKHRVKSHLLPRIVLPDMMRILKRTTFSLSNWRFIFTCEWAAPTRGEAEFKQSLYKSNRTIVDDDLINLRMQGQKDLCVHKIKIELIGSKEYIDQSSTEYLALSLLFKICSLLSGSIFAIQPITS
jgi:hypothetical protein